MIKEYYRLAKPGIVYGNVITTIAAFLFATQWHFTDSTLPVFAATIVGISFVIGSACVFNNYLDRDIDKRMDRTKNRALVTGRIKTAAALTYASVLGLIGISMLYLAVNLLTAEIALIGFVSYVLIYGMAKRQSHWGAVVGSVPGAVPIVVGYTAVTNHLDATALILFLILVTWQMPHFYAIAMYRLKEYQEAGIPVLPAKKGMRKTKIHILLYIIAFLIASCSLTIFGYTGLWYFAVMMLLCDVWLYQALKGFSKDTVDDSKWARKTFFFSLIMLLGFCVILAVAPLLR